MESFFRWGDPEHTGNPIAIGKTHGGQYRVGNATDAAELTALSATVIDLSDVRANDPVNHGKFMELATIGPELRSVLASGVKASHGPGAAAVSTNSLVNLLGAPVKIIGAVAQ
jgi:esterase/lipase superfamily enzyme